MQHEKSSSDTPLRRAMSPGTIAACMIAVIVAVYLLREHWGHVVGSWPYVLLLLCPLMHLLHRHHDHQ
jgi:hypothetical protein